MIFQIFDHSGCNFGGGIISRIATYGRQWLTVFKMHFWAEESACIFELIGVVKAFAQRLAVDMPFPGMIRAITTFF